MKLVEWSDKNSWNRFVADHAQPSAFLQSWEWGEFQKTQGNEVLRLGFIPAQTREYERGDLLGVVSLLKRRLPLPGLYFWYLPRGPVLRRDNLGSQEIFIRQLLANLHDNRDYAFLRIIPPWSKSQNKTHWANLGFDQLKFLTRQREPETTLLTRQSPPEDRLARMHKKTRYNIRLAQRKGVRLRLYESELDLEIFWRLLKETSAREKIRLYKKDYYTILMLSAKLITDFKSRINRAELRSIMSFAVIDNTPLACGLWLGYGNTLTYLHGGSSRKHKEVMAPYLMHWEMIQWAFRQDYSYYDWWGIDQPGGVFHLGGVSRFKRGFGGEEYELAGAYDHVTNKKLYKYLGILKKMKEIF